VQPKERRRLDHCCEFRQPRGADEESRQSKDKAIKRRQIWRALSGSPGDDELVLEQQGLGRDGADAASSREFGERDDQVNREEE